MRTETRSAGRVADRDKGRDVVRWRRSGVAPENEIGTAWTEVWGVPPRFVACEDGVSGTDGAPPGAMASPLLVAGCGEAEEEVMAHVLASDRRLAVRLRWRSIVAGVSLVWAVAMVAAPTVAARQPIPSGEPALTVSGSGEAVAPADRAEVQLLISREPAEFSRTSMESQGGSSGSSSTSGVLRAVSEGTPVGGDDGLNEATLAPILDALAEKGIARDEVELQLSPLAVEPFGSRAGSARFDFEVERPDPDAIGALIQAASDAAAGTGFVVEVAGVRYEVTDCAPLEEEAQREALANAQAAAVRLAGLLDVELGEVVAANSYRSSGPDDEACGDRGGSYYDSGFGGLGVELPPFEPARPAEVTYQTELTVSYAFSRTSSA